MADSDDGYSSASDSEQALSLSTYGANGGASSSTNPLGAPAAKKAKGKGKQQQKDDDKDKDPSRKRSSKACDNCRKSKCKCTRILDPATNEPVGPCQNCLQVGAECTFLGASRKRGPPKGYIEAIESRLHRMEALLGGLLGSDDPRAQTLLGELIGDNEARDVLTRDLKAAADSTKPPKRSWKREFVESQEQLKRQQQAEQAQAQAQLQAHAGYPQQQQPIISTGFDGSTSTVAPDGRVHAAAPMWLTEEDLSGLGGAGAGGLATTDPLGNALGFDPASFGGLAASSGPATGGVAAYGSPSGGSFGGVSAPINPLTGSANPLLVSSAPNTSGMNIDLAASPRQRRRLDLPTFGTSPSAIPVGGGSPSATTSQPGAMSGIVAAGSPNAGFPSSFGGSTSSMPGIANPERRQMAYAFTLPPHGTAPPRSSAHSAGPVLSPAVIGHTGSAQYNLNNDGSDGNAAETEEERKKRDEPLTELADVVGQLSLNENAEVRYHGRSSGLYLIAKSQRFRNFFWQFPSAGVWPPSDVRILKTEREILQLADAEDALPDMQTQSHLLSAYWTYIHPHFPLIEKITHMRQYRHSLAHPDSNEGVPTVLLLSMFALAARYCDLDEARKDGKYWTAGEQYLEKARRILNHDYGSSKLVTVQALLLISYREIGVGAMSSAWMTCGMAIRMAQDLGLFRDVDKWYLPIQKFAHEEKQTRKRVWWACVILDRYISSYIGRPGTIHERDYDTGLCSEDEPDEHEQWRPVRLDGTEWSAEPKAQSDWPPSDVAKTLKAYPPCRSHALSCFNAAGALAVIINRIISNIYAIRIRVLGQSSETLLSLLDQSLASWYLALPSHLQYNPAGTKVPPPHILSLHLQFYSSLILLHRPFIPGQNSKASLGNFPSHSICTTSANAIANIVTTWRKTFTLRQCPPFLTYPIFSAAIICVYNASFDEALAQPAKLHLSRLMSALKEMELTWGSAIRAWDLLHGLVDLRDAELNADLARLNEEANRGTKRPAMDVDEPSPSSFNDVRPTNFHNRPPLGGRTQSKSATARRRSSVSTSGGARAPSSSRASLGKTGSPVIRENAPIFPAPMPPTGSQPSGFPVHSPPFSFPPPAGAPSMPSLAPASMPPLASASASTSTAQTFDILNPALDLSQFKTPPGTSSGAANFSELLNSFLSPADLSGASTSASAASIPSFMGGLPGAVPLASTGAGPEASTATPAASAQTFDPTAAFFGMPLGADLTEDWFNYSYNAFAAASDQGGTPDSAAAGTTAAAGGSPNPPVA
ncbi:hypothetical protein JCM6882_002448 [Rhodosporidiobolus microsporus]